MRYSLLAPLALATFALAQDVTLIAIRDRPLAPVVAGVTTCNTTGNARTPGGLLLPKCRIPLIAFEKQTITKRSWTTDDEESAMEEFVKAEVELSGSNYVDVTAEAFEDVDVATSKDGEEKDEEESGDISLEGSEKTTEKEEKTVVEESVAEEEPSEEVVEASVEVAESAAEPCQNYRLMFPADCCPTSFIKRRYRRWVPEADIKDCEENTVHIQHTCPLPALRMADEILQKAKLDLYNEMAQISAKYNVVMDCGVEGYYYY